MITDDTSGETSELPCSRQLMKVWIVEVESHICRVKGEADEVPEGAEKQFTKGWQEVR